MEIEEVKELLEEKKFNELKLKLKEMKSADISAILDELEDKESVVKVFRILSKEKAGMTFSYMESDMREKLIQDLTDAELKNVIDELFMDDTVDLIEEMPSNVVTRILKAVNKKERNPLCNTIIFNHTIPHFFIFKCISIKFIQDTARRTP